MSSDRRVWRCLLVLGLAACPGDATGPGWMASQHDATSLAASN